MSTDASEAHEEGAVGIVDPKSDSQYIQFRCLPPGGPLNRWPHIITREHDFPASQVRTWQERISDLRVIHLMGDDGDDT